MQSTAAGQRVASFRNIGVTGVQDLLNGNLPMTSSNAEALMGPTGLAWSLLGATGKALSYGWWIVSFQLFMLAYTAFVVLKAPAKRLGAVGMLTVLTASTFLYTYDVCNSTFGAYALSHNLDGGAASVIGTHARKARKAKSDHAHTRNRNPHPQRKPLHHTGPCVAARRASVRKRGGGVNALPVGASFVRLTQQRLP